MTADENIAVTRWTFVGKVTSLLFNLSEPQWRDVTLPTKVRLVKAMVFPVVRYGGES